LQTGRSLLGVLSGLAATGAAIRFPK
jgi:hypothetical protein